MTVCVLKTAINIVIFSKFDAKPNGNEGAVLMERRCGDLFPIRKFMTDRDNIATGGRSLLRAAALATACVGLTLSAPAHARSVPPTSNAEQAKQPVQLPLVPLSAGAATAQPYDLIIHAG